MVAEKEPKVISRTSEVESDYKWGFFTDIEMDMAPKGLNENIVRLISSKKNEPEWMTEWRLKAFRYWMTLEYKEPDWAMISVRSNWPVPSALMRKYVISSIGHLTPGGT